MTYEDFVSLGKECKEIIKQMAPIKTGNLRDNAIKEEMPDDKTFVIYVSDWEKTGVAPYMKYTNEEWHQKIIKMGNFVPGEVVERMRTWKNPNEGWFDRAARTVALYVANKTKGEISL